MFSVFATAGRETASVPVAVHFPCDGVGTMSEKLARCSLRQTCRPHSVGAFAVGGSDRLGLLLISSLSRRPIKLTTPPLHLAA
jgi:hypothetical protein